MDISLFKAAEALRGLLDQIDETTGEMPEGFEDARALVSTKAVAVTAYILENGKQAEYLKEAAKELMDRARTAEKRNAWLRQYLASHMAGAGITKIADERGLFSATLDVGRDKAVEVFDAAQLPDDYMRLIPAKVEPDKSLIAQAIKDGFDVPGARVVARDRLTIR
ncbi:MAG: siphovirus Gp157 family protein [Burkholderiaceae bacterium]|nr:siphovirus Gp157 family protein [Burkholderiaceae bacterium]